MKVHHIGYLVKNMSEAVVDFQLLGYTVSSEAVCDNLRDIDICFMSNNETNIELIVPHQSCKNFSSLRKKIGNAPYHICYISEDFENDLEVLQEKGFLLIDSPKPAVAISNRNVAFLMSDSIGLIELLEGEE